MHRPPRRNRPLRLAAFAFVLTLPLTLHWTGFDEPHGSMPSLGNVDADTIHCLQQINDDGFGSHLNRYAWSMAELDGELYVSTFHTYTERDVPAADPGTRSIVDSDGGEIWRYDGLDWEQVMSDGFGLGGNGGEGVRSLIEHDGALFAATHDEDGPSRVWSSADGETWTLISEPGFGSVQNQSIRALASWNGVLYAGTENTLFGGEIWAYDGVEWTLVADGGVTTRRNQVVMEFLVYQGELYVGMYNIGDGLELLRFDGSSFETVVGAGAPTPAGFGDRANASAMSLAEFQGYLYVGSPSLKGFTVWRSGDAGASWTEVTPADAPGLNGKKIPYPWYLHVHDGRLYLGVFAGVKDDPADVPLSAVLWSTEDGVDWIQEIGPSGRLAPDGIGDLMNYGIRTLATFEGELIIGTAQCFYCPAWPVTGAEVWRRIPECVPPPPPPPPGGCNDQT